ncbi:unnamed protein product, partial [Brachionus calyciflorus]
PSNKTIQNLDEEEDSEDENENEHIPNSSYSKKRKASVFNVEFYKNIEKFLSKEEQNMEWNILD